ncbi:MAG TPA: TlpA disulfide reductase family protein [Burkholderiales bacterium]|nr:TlpA disulfide reductase family protein [Burkholderiales bacterium]
MKRAREWVLIAVVGLAAGAAGYGYNVWRIGPAEQTRQGLADLTGARLPDLDGALQSVAQWRGKVVVVNFWATWCAPCREEIPMLVKLQQKYGAHGLQLVGIAIDRPEKVRPYAAEMGMNFPVLLASLDGIELTRRLGNKAGVLPYTVVLDRDGEIARLEVGALKEARIEALVAGLL